MVSPTTRSTFPVNCTTLTSSMIDLYFERMSTRSWGRIFIMAVARYSALALRMASSMVSSWLEILASIAPTSVSIMQPPRSTLESS